MVGHGEKRSRKGEAFIAALLVHPSIPAAADAVGISVSAASRWLKDPAFAAQYAEARRDAMKRTTAALQAAATGAVGALAEITRDGESESARVSAAKAILDQALRSVEIEDFEQRLAALEQAMNGDVK